MRLSAGASSCALCGPGFFSNSTGCNSTFLILKSSFVGFARNDVHVVGRLSGGRRLVVSWFCMLSRHIRCYRCVFLFSLCCPWLYLLSGSRKHGEHLEVFEIV